MGERCIGSIHTEDARLPDLEQIFREVFRAHTGSASHLPRGSLIMLGSYSHLASSGLAAYTEELTRVIRSMRMLVGGGATVIPTVLPPLGVWLGSLGSNCFLILMLGSLPAR